MTRSYDTHPRTSVRLAAGRRVRDLLRSSIVHRELRSGVLPSETDLARAFSTSRQVIRDALALLRSEGLVRRSRGTGTLSTASMLRHDFRFLHGPQKPDVAVERRVLLCVEQPAPPLVAQRLNLNGATNCGLVETLTILDGEPLDLTTLYIPVGLLPLVHKLGPADEWFTLYDRAEIQLGVTDHSIEAAAADDLVARILEIDTGHPLLMLERLVRDHDGRPLEYGFTRVRGDRLTLTQSTPMARPAARASQKLAAEVSGSIR